MLVTTSKRALKYSKGVFFLPCLNGAYPEENLDLFKQLFSIKPVKGYKYKQKMFSTQSEQHIAKLCLSVVLKHFWGNS